MSGTTESVPLDGHQQISNRLVELQNALQAQTPGYESILQRIHKDLQSDPDLVHLLSDEQVGVLVAGLSKKKNVVITEPEKATKRNKTADGKKSLKDIDINDI